MKSAYERGGDEFPIVAWEVVAQELAVSSSFDSYDTSQVFSNKLRDLGIEVSPLLLHVVMEMAFCKHYSEFEACLTPEFLADIEKSYKLLVAGQAGIRMVSAVASGDEEACEIYSDFYKSHLNCDIRREILFYGFKVRFCIPVAKMFFEDAQLWELFSNVEVRDFFATSAGSDVLAAFVRMTADLSEVDCRTKWKELLEIISGSFTFKYFMESIIVAHGGDFLASISRSKNNPDTFLESMRAKKRSGEIFLRKRMMSGEGTLGEQLVPADVNQAQQVVIASRKAARRVFISSMLVELYPGNEEINSAEN